MIVVAGVTRSDQIPGAPTVLLPDLPRDSAVGVAVALARLGQPVRPVARFGEDEFARLPLPLAVHSCSPAPETVATTQTDFLAYLRRRDSVTVSIGLDLSPPSAGDTARERARTLPAVPLAHIVTASEDDLARLYPGVPPASVLASWRAAGVSCGVVTLGADGAYLMAPNGLAYRRTAISVDVVDTVGAGDAFTGGLLAALADAGGLGERPVERLALIRPAQWLSILDFAGRVASLTCTRPGADPPTLADLAEADLAAANPGGLRPNHRIVPDRLAGRGTPVQSG